MIMHYRHHYEGYNNDGNIHNDHNNGGDNR